MVVDAANVVGSRPDGWWRDRAGAAERLLGQIEAALASGRLEGPVAVVLEGRAGPEAGLLYHLPMFAPLPLAVTDLLAAEAEPRQFPAGAVVMREGEVGDRFYLITDGAAAVSVRGEPKPSLRRGDGFGEIAEGSVGVSYLGVGEAAIVVGDAIVRIRR